MKVLSLFDGISCGMVTLERGRNRICILLSAKFKKSSQKS